MTTSPPPSGPITPGDVTALLRLTLTDPSSAAKAVLGYGVPREHHWTLFLLAITLSGVVYAVGRVLGGAPEPGELNWSPFTIVAVSGAEVLVLAAAIRWVGRMAGGTAELEDVLLLCIWFQLVQTALGAGLLLVVLLVPPLGALLLVGVALVSLWVLASFIAVAHGFRSVWQVMLGMVVAAVALVFVLSLLIAPFAGASSGA